MQHQQQQSVRPLSTYDNLSARNNNSNNSNFKQQQQQQLLAGESSGLTPVAIGGNNESSTTTIIPQISNDAAAASSTPATTTTTTTQDLNETSHSIAAVRAALSDAKSKFFGININEKLTMTPNCARIEMDAIKPVSPQSARKVHQQPELAANDKTPMAQSQRFGATYEQIPLADLDAPSPSQAVYMSTTVPQNMKGIKIAGRHTPTRNSLRHSRMIVVNHKSHDSIEESYSTHIRYMNLSRQLLILQMAIGMLIVGLAIWILILAPSASILINPYLSGLSLLLASIAGLILLGRDRRADYQRSAHNNCYKVLLAESYVFSALALIFCCLALVCAAIEFAELQSTTAPSDGSCGPASSSLLSYRNCSCLTDEQQTASLDTFEQDRTDAVDSNNIETSCEAIRNEWKYLLGFSMALNTVGIFATFLYITIFICCLNINRKHFNTSV